MISTNMTFSVNKTKLYQLVKRVCPHYVTDKISSYVFDYQKNYGCYMLKNIDYTFLVYFDAYSPIGIIGYFSICVFDINSHMITSYEINYQEEIQWLTILKTLHILDSPFK